MRAPLFGGEPDARANHPRSLLLRSLLATLVGGCSMGRDDDVMGERLPWLSP